MMNGNIINYYDNKNPDEIINYFKENIHTTSECIKNILNDAVFGSFFPPNQTIDWMLILIDSKWDFNENNQLFIDGIIKINDSVVDCHPDVNKYSDKVFRKFSNWILEKLKYYTEKEKIAGLINLSESFGEYYDGAV